MAHVASFECGMLPLNVAATRGDLAAVRRLLPEIGDVDMASIPDQDLLDEFNRRGLISMVHTDGLLQEIKGRVPSVPDSTNPMVPSQ